MELWRDASEVISSRKQLNVSVPLSPLVCTGSEWYLFTSHFFLPEGARLAFLEDGFGGILPQHFNFGRSDPTVFSALEAAPAEFTFRRNGTFLPPLQPFNDRNREETSRYVQLPSCDFIVLLVDGNDFERMSSKSPLDSIRLKIVSSNILQQYSIGNGVVNRSIEFSVGEGSSEVLSYSIAAARRVLSSQLTTSSLARAYFIPLKSIDQKIRYKYYILLRKT